MTRMLFIGGPLDGEVRDVPAGLTFKVDDALYVREEMRFGHHGHIRFFRLATMRIYDAVKAVFDHYRGK